MERNWSYQSGWTVPTIGHLGHLGRSITRLGSIFFGGTSGTVATIGTVDHDHGTTHSSDASCLLAHLANECQSTSGVGTLTVCNLETHRNAHGRPRMDSLPELKLSVAARIEEFEALIRAHDPHHRLDRSRPKKTRRAGQGAEPAGHIPLKNEHVHCHWRQHRRKLSGSSTSGYVSTTPPTPEPFPAQLDPEYRRLEREIFTQCTWPDEDDIPWAELDVAHVEEDVELLFSRCDQKSLSLSPPPASASASSFFPLWNSRASKIHFSSDKCQLRQHFSSKTRDSFGCSSDHEVDRPRI